jgi:hypothetical protein
MTFEGLGPAFWVAPFRGRRKILLVAKSENLTPVTKMDSTNVWISTGMARSWCYFLLESLLGSAQWIV